MKSPTQEPEEHRNNAFQIIHEYSMELAYMKYEDIFPGIIKQIYKLFNAKGALISIYDETTQNLEVSYTTLSDKENSRFAKLLGKSLIGFKVHVTEDNYKMMTESIVGEASSLYELTFGAIPEIISKTIEKIFGFGDFVPVVLLYKSSLVGTMVIALNPGQAKPDREVLLAFAGITANALERKNAELRREAAIEALRQSEARYRLLAENMSGTIWLMDMSLKITYLSPSVIKFRGFSAEEIMALPYDKNITPESLKLALKVFAEEKDKFLSNPSYILDRTLELEYYRKDGSTYWSENRFRMIRDENGKPEAILGEGRDITERKQAEYKIKESEEKYKFLTNNIPDIIYSLDGEGKIATINSTALERFGYTEQSSIGKPFMDFIHPEDREILIKSFLKALEEKRKETTGLQFRLVAKNGNCYWFELNARARFDNKGSYIGEEGVLRDITDRRQAEDKIKSLLEEKELLLQEVYHRIKNNMNTIKGLLSLQISAEENPSTIESLLDAESRVQSMIFLYDRLNCSENYRELSVKEYITSLAEEIIGSFPGRGKVELKSEISDFILNVKLLTPIGIIVNEILTNTMKHAFIGRDRGLITLSASHNKNHVVIIIQDNGVGVPETVSFENSTGFGMQLVGMLVEQIDGSIRIERGTGSKFVLEFDI